MPLPKTPILDSLAHEFERAKLEVLDSKMLAMNTASIGEVPNRMVGYTPLHMVLMRLRLTQASQLPFKQIIAIMENDVAGVVIVHKGKILTVMDDPDLFPSDKLIAEINLLKA